MTIVSIGVMDVGAGNCTLLIDDQHKPVAYFDIGYPLFPYYDSAPVNIFPGQPGPIRQNPTNDLGVILSHWDWDHYRLGCVHNMHDVPWTVPQQPLGAMATNWQNVLAAQGNLFAFGPAGPGTVVNSALVFPCVPPPGAARSELMNNSGIALQVFMRLPSAGLPLPPPPTAVALTGDASFRNIPYDFVFNTGLMAVHHGSDSHHASEDLPAVDLSVRPNGRVVYSYGIRADGRHVNGHPRAPAVANYVAADWSLAISTAEGLQINNAPPAIANRGNILIGDAAGFAAGAPYFPLPAAVCQNTAFSSFRYNRD